VGGVSTIKKYGWDWNVTYSLVPLGYRWNDGDQEWGASFYGSSARVGDAYRDIPGFGMFKRPSYTLQLVYRVGSSGLAWPVITCGSEYRLPDAGGDATTVVGSAAAWVGPHTCTQIAINGVITPAGAFEYTRTSDTHTHYSAVGADGEVIADGSRDLVILGGRRLTATCSGPGTASSNGQGVITVTSDWIAVGQSCSIDLGVTSASSAYGPVEVSGGAITVRNGTTDGGWDATTNPWTKKPPVAPHYESSNNPDIPITHYQYTRTFTVTYPNNYHMVVRAVIATQ